MSLLFIVLGGTCFYESSIWTQNRDLRSNPREDIEDGYGSLCNRGVCVCICVCVCVCSCSILVLIKGIVNLDLISTLICVGQIVMDSCHVIIVTY